MQRAGNRRHYRPEDTALVRRIDHLLNREGYTVRGVQQLLAAEGQRPPPGERLPAGGSIALIVAIRDTLRHALAEDAAAVAC